MIERSAILIGSAVGLVAGAGTYVAMDRAMAGDKQKDVGGLPGVRGHSFTTDGDGNGWAAGLVAGAVGGAVGAATYGALSTYQVEFFGSKASPAMRYGLVGAIVGGMAGAALHNVVGLFRGPQN